MKKVRVIVYNHKTTVHGFASQRFFREIRKLYKPGTFIEIHEEKSASNPIKPKRKYRSKNR